jgi:hypothetical protein
MDERGKDGLRVIRPAIATDLTQLAPKRSKEKVIGRTILPLKIPL